MESEQEDGGASLVKKAVVDPTQIFRVSRVGIAASQRGFLVECERASP